VRSALNPGPLKPQGRRPPRVSSSPFELTPAPLDSYGLHRQHRHDAHMLHTHGCTFPRLNCPWNTCSRAICSSRFVCVRRRYMDEDSRSRSRSQRSSSSRRAAAERETHLSFRRSLARVTDGRPCRSRVPRVRRLGCPPSSLRARSPAQVGRDPRSRAALQSGTRDDISRSAARSLDRRLCACSNERLHASRLAARPLVSLVVSYSHVSERVRLCECASFGASYRAPDPATAAR
jgi:hypothetical protein